MNRSSMRTHQPLIYVANPDVLGGELLTLVGELVKQLPDCEFKVISPGLEAENISNYPSNSMFLVLNTKLVEAQTQSLIIKLEEDQRKYVVYPQPVSAPRSFGYKATTFSELLRYLSQMLMQNIGSMSEISNHTINKSQKPNVSLHVIIAKSSDQQFRSLVKVLYKKYKSNPVVDFFESKNLQKIHTSLFPKILFVINQIDVQKYRASFETFVSKKSPSGSINTVLFRGKSNVSPYGFEYNQTANSKQILENILMRSIENASKSKQPKSGQRNQSFAQPLSTIQHQDSSQVFIFVLDSVDTVYRSFYSQIKSGYQRVNHLNIPFGSKSILIVPSSARDFLGQIFKNPNVKVILVTQETSPSLNLKYQQGIQLITKNIDELNFYLKKENSGGRRVTDFHQSQIKVALDKSSYLKQTENVLVDRKPSINYNTTTTPPLSTARLSSQNILNANLSKVTESNLEYTLTQYNQQTNRSIKSSETSTPKLRTTQLIIQQTQSNMNTLYNNCLKDEEYAPPLPPPAPRSASVRKPSISISRQQYGGDYQDQIIETKNSIKVGSKRSSNSSINNQPELSLQSQINASIVRDSVRNNSRIRDQDSLITHPSALGAPRISMYKEKTTNLGDRRSLMRNTPDQYDIERRSSSRKQNLGGTQRSSLVQQINRNREMNQERNSEYYVSGITSPMRSSIMTSARSGSRPKSSKIAGKLSVIECLGETRSKTLSQMLEKHNKSIREHSQIDEFQLQFGDESSLQLVFRVSSPYIQHLSRYFEVYPSTIIRYSDTNELLEVVPSLNKSAKTILIIDSQIVQNVRSFKSFQDFNYIIVCKEENMSRVKHKFPNTVIMKQDSHNKSFKQLLSYIRYLKFKEEQFRISDKQLIPHISALHSLKIYSPSEPLVDQFAAENLQGYEIVNYNGEGELLGLLQNNMFGNNVHNVVILKDAEERLIQYLVSSVFNVKKIIVYGGERDLPQLKSQLVKIAA